jgi:hypothetical protein
MNDVVRLAEIELVQQHIIDALVRTNQPTTLSEDDQDRVLSQACAEACGILDRWLNSPAWDDLRPKGRGPIADIIPDWQAIRPFLDPLGPVINRMREHRRTATGLEEIDDPEAYIDDLIAQTKVTGRRNPGFDRQHLYEEASERINHLRSTVCVIAGDFAKGAKNRSRLRAAARSALKKVGLFLVSAALISAGVTTTAAAHDMSAAAHEAVSVVFVHQAAHAAQPTVRVGSAQVGPQLGPRLG